MCLLLFNPSCLIMMQKTCWNGTPSYFRCNTAKFSSWSRQNESVYKVLFDEIRNLFSLQFSTQVKPINFLWYLRRSYYSFSTMCISFHHTSLLLLSLLLLCPLFHAAVPKFTDKNSSQLSYRTEQVNINSTARTESIMENGLVSDEPRFISTPQASGQLGNKHSNGIGSFPIPGHFEHVATATAMPKPVSYDHNTETKEDPTEETPLDTPVPTKTPAYGLVVPPQIDKRPNSTTTDSFPGPTMASSEERNPTRFCVGQARRCYYKSNCFRCVCRRPDCPNKDLCSKSNRMQYCVRKCGNHVKVCLRR